MQQWRSCRVSLVLILTTVTLFSGITDSLLGHLQWVQNVAARLVTGTRRCDYIMPVLRAQLHWLPVRQWVDFKLALLVYKVLHDATVAYLVDDCQLVSHASCCWLRSADIDVCCVPLTNTQFGDRSFAAHWTTALEQSAGQDLPARQWHWRISSAAKVIFVEVTPWCIVTFCFSAPFKYSYWLIHSQHSPRLNGPTSKGKGGEKGEVNGREEPTSKGRGGKEGRTGRGREGWPLCGQIPIFHFQMLAAMETGPSELRALIARKALLVLSTWDSQMARDGGHAKERGQR